MKHRIYPKIVIDDTIKYNEGYWGSSDDDYPLLVERLTNMHNKNEVTLLPIYQYAGTGTYNKELTYFGKFIDNNGKIYMLGVMQWPSADPQLAEVKLEKDTPNKDNTGENSSADLEVAEDKIKNILD